MLKTLETIVNMESFSSEKHLTDKLADKLVEIFEQTTGGKAQIIPNKDFGNHVRGEWGQGDEQVLILCHFDTVWPEGTTKTNPFRIDPDGTKAYGPGIYDMKGGLVQGLYAVNALQTLGKKTNKKVVFLFNSDEEVGSLTSKELILAEAAKSKYVLVLEPSAPGGAVKISRKGVGMFDIKVTGKPVHAGNDHEKGRSAIEELARQIQYIHSLTDYDKQTTLSVGIIQGGSTRNTVAEHAEAQIDLRIQTAAEAERIYQIIMNLKPQTEGTTLQITGEINRPPMERNAQMLEIYGKAKKIAQEELGLDLLEKAVGGASDGNFTSVIKPTLDGIGAVGDGAHANHEYIDLTQMPQRSALVALLLEKM